MIHCHFILESWRNTKHCRLIMGYCFLLNLQCFTKLKYPYSMKVQRTARKMEEKTVAERVTILW